MFKQKNGTIYLGFSAGSDDPDNLDDMVHGVEHPLFESKDQGWNWFLKVNRQVCHDPWPMGQLNDGTILSFNGVYFKSYGELFGIGCRSAGEQVFADSKEIPVRRDVRHKTASAAGRLLKAALKGQYMHSPG